VRVVPGLSLLRRGGPPWPGRGRVDGGPSAGRAAALWALWADRAGAAAAPAVDIRPPTVQAEPHCRGAVSWASGAAAGPPRPPLVHLCAGPHSVSHAHCSSPAGDCRCAAEAVFSDGHVQGIAAVQPDLSRRSGPRARSLNQEIGDAYRRRHAVM
jgi:hypothetical protein